MVKINISHTFGYLMVSILTNFHKYSCYFQWKKESEYYQDDIFYQYLCMLIHHYEKLLLDLQQFGQNQHFIYLWIFDAFNFDKLSQIQLLFSVEKGVSILPRWHFYQYFMCAYSLLWLITFRPVTIWSKSTFHILMDI